MFVSLNTMNRGLLGAVLLSACTTHSALGVINAPLTKVSYNSHEGDFPNRSIEGFSITVNYSGSAEEEALFDAAAAAWESRITGYRGVMSVSTVTINASVEPIDGAGGILGSAGPDSASIQDEDGLAGGNKFALVTEGSMSFDSADAAALTASVIEHEMGHVLGFGTLWNTDSLGGVFAGTQALYTDGSGQFTGAAATARWQSEFGQTEAYVSVELDGGPGTANGHWDEVNGGAGLTGINQTITGNDMRNELMTGWLNTPTFVSQMTLDSLYDIGFMVVPEPSAYAALLGCIALAIAIGRSRRRATKF